jgi:signal transduction histidine kinase/ActR/RegA family two-component response regulator
LTKKWLLAGHARIRLDELERLVGERTRNLEEANQRLQGEIEERVTIAEALRVSENQLRQAQKMEAVGQLAAGIAHDFNNILTVILGHTSHLLEGASASHPMTESLQEVSTAAKRAASLTRQLLAFSRKQVMQPRALDLNAVIRDLNKMLTRLIGEHIALRFTFAAEPLPVFADAGSLEQILVNLAVNARDAMSEGGQLRIQTSSVVLDAASVGRNPDARPGPYARVSVADNGCGMSASTMERIFEPFFTTKDVGKGSGLGLASVYGILHQQHGWIEVESQPARGSTFTFFIPLTVKSITAPPIEAEPNEEKSGRREKILLVEDEHAVRGMICAVLQRHGYQVFPAANGDEALKLWQSHKGGFDLALTDMVMPGGISGHDLAKTFLAANPRIKILYSSGYSMELAKADAMGHKNLFFLPKPYDIAKLKQVVRECLEDEEP